MSRSLQTPVDQIRAVQRCRIVLNDPPRLSLFVAKRARRATESAALSSTNGGKPSGGLTIARMATVLPQTRLIVLRGNSGSGKSTAAKALRETCGRGVAWVSQDLIRRIILKEKDRPGAASIGLIDQVVRFSLDHGYQAILDGSCMPTGTSRCSQGSSATTWVCPASTTWMSASTRRCAGTRSSAGVRVRPGRHARMVSAARPPDHRPGAGRPGNQHPGGDRQFDPGRIPDSSSHEPAGPVARYQCRGHSLRGCSDGTTVADGVPLASSMAARNRHDHLGALGLPTRSGFARQPSPRQMRRSRMPGEVVVSSAPAGTPNPAT